MSTLNRTRPAALLGAALASTMLVGCTVSGGGLPTGLPNALLGALVPFDACDDALEYLRVEARQRVGPYGLDGGYRKFASDGDFAAEDSLAGAAPTAGRAGDGQYSGTNNQEAGVDEADVVKTDGSFLYTVVDGALQVTDLRGGAPEVVAQLPVVVPVPGSDAPIEDIWYGYGPTQLLLSDTTLLVLMTRPVPWLDEGAAGSEGDAAARLMPPGWGGWGWTESVLVAVDVTDPTAPRETARLSVDGDYLSARMVDGTARVVVRSQPQLPFEHPYSEEPDANWRELERAATERNREVIASSTIEQWLPSYTLDVAGDTSEGQLMPCERVSHPTAFSGFTTVSVLTVPLTAGGLDVPMAAGVVGDGEIVYASTGRLYVVTNRWSSGPADGADVITPEVGRTTTGIHAFDITGTGLARHVASGEVDGRVIGQYALSEHEGVLRVATTTGDMWGEGQVSESSITTLAERDGDLVELGTVGGLGKGEQIYAVRYLGDTAYVVTFRQTDPLYVIDLSDPASPRELGELKITGYSAYLHPLDDGRVIGVGQEATLEGQTIGLQVSLFDTSDPAAPTKIDGEVLEDTWSDVEWDPHAFLSWAASGQIMLPVSGERSSGLLVVSVSDDGLEQDGMVLRADDAGSGDWYGQAPTRAVVVDDRLYTLWWDGVQANDLDTLEPLGWAGFER